MSNIRGLVMIYTLSIQRATIRMVNYCLLFFVAKVTKADEANLVSSVYFSLYPLKTHPALSLEIQCKIDFIRQKKEEWRVQFWLYSFLAYTNFFAIACGNRKTAILARKFGVFTCKMRENAIILLKIYKKQWRDAVVNISGDSIRVHIGDSLKLYSGNSPRNYPLYVFCD